MKSLFSRLVAAFGLLLGLTLPVIASATLTITPITWDVVGLDSNDPVNSGPQDFPVGVRVCSTTAVTNVPVSFSWDDGMNAYTGDPYINLASNAAGNTNSAVTIASIAANDCAVAFFNVRVTRDANAFDKSRQYRITSGVASTPTPRQIYVEHIVSQNRNATAGMTITPATGGSTATVPSGGSYTMMAGSTYTVVLTAWTSTNGYDSLQSFLNLPNNVFRVNSVTTTYEALTSSNVAVPNPSVWADACVYDQNPNSPTYRSCLSTGKAGGFITVTYNVTVIANSAATWSINPTHYDFSGASYHYNSDYAKAVRTFSIATPTSGSTISKSFSPNPTTPGGISVLTITINNTNAGSVSGYSFSDTLPAGMQVASTPGASTSGCGAATWAPAASDTTLSFSNGTIAANSSCIVKVNVTTPAGTSGTTTYSNTISNLAVGGVTTGQTTGTVNLVTSPSSFACGQTLAYWTFPTGFSATAPVKTIGAVTATAAAGSGVSAKAGAGTITVGGDGTQSWWFNGGFDKTLVPSSNEYVQFAIDTTGQTSVYLSFYAVSNNNGPLNLNIYAGSTSGSSGDTTSNYKYTQLITQVSSLTNTSFVKYGSNNAFAFTSANGLNSSGTTYFRIYGYNSNNANPGSDLYLDNVLFTGCAPSNAPSISKAFSTATIAAGGAATKLTFTLSNPNGTAETGAKFTDALPAGLAVASSPNFATTCTNPGAPSWTSSVTSGITTLAFGQTTGGRIPPASGGNNGTCTASVDVVASAAGPYQNISGYLSTTESGTNSASLATASVTAVAAPSISKAFSPNPIVPGAKTRLTFSIVNPNSSDALAGVAFSDSLPTGSGGGQMVVASPATTSNSGCGAPTVTATAGASSVAATGIAIVAGGTCTIIVEVTAPTIGSFNNTTGNVSHTVNGATVNGNTASSTLSVIAGTPAISLLKQVAPSNTGPWSSYLPVAGGANVYFRFTVENVGNVPLTLTSPVVVDDQINSLVSNCQWYTPTGNKLSLPGTLAVAGTSNTDYLVTCVVGPVTANTKVTNTATASGSNGTTVSSTSSATYDIAALTLVKSASQATYPTTPGTTITYTYAVTNSGSATMYAPITIYDDRLGTIACLASGWIAGNGSTECTANYITTATDITRGYITNVAQASAYDAATSGNLKYSPATSKTIYATGGAGPDLSIIKTQTVPASGSAVASYEGVTYTLLVANATAGPDVTNAVVTDPSVNNLSVLSVSCGSTTTYNSKTSTCPSAGATTVTLLQGAGIVIPSLPAGTSVTLTVTGRAWQTSVDTRISNTATVTPPSGTTDSNLANNTSSVTTNVTGGGVTLAVISGVRSYLDGGKVWLEWETGSEVGTAGYHVWRWDPARETFTRVNGGLLPALIGAPVGGVYRLVDPVAMSGGTYRYLIQEVEALGLVNSFGPYEVTVMSTAAKALAASATAIAKAGAAAVGPAASETNFEATAHASGGRTLPVANAPAGAATSTLQGATTMARSVTPTMVVSAAKATATAARILVEDEGIYAVGVEQLAAVLGQDVARLKSRLASGKLRLRQKGQSVAWGHDAANTALYFYGQPVAGVDAVYTRYNIYWLDLEDGKAIDWVNGRVSKATAGGLPYPTRVHVERNMPNAYGPYQNDDPDADFWYWGYVAASAPGLGTPASFVVPTPGAARSGQATLRANLQGATELAPNGNDHHAHVKVNGTEVGQLVWSGMTPATLTATFPANLLAADGSNTVVLQAELDSGVPYSVIYVDSFDIDYLRQYRAEGNQLTFTGAGNHAVTVSGYTDPNILVFDVSDVRQPQWLRGTKVIAAPGGAAVSFTPKNATATYVAGVPKAPVAVQGFTPSTLKSTDNRGNYLVLTPKALREGADALTAYRTGLGSRVVELQEIYDEFADGIANPHAIQAFLAYAAKNWKTQPRYVALVGKGTFDPKDYMGLGTNLFPVLMTSTPDGLFAADNRYADVDGDGVPDMALGRIPALVSQDVKDYVVKLAAYEGSGRGSANQALLVADRRDAAGDFTADSQEVSQALLTHGVVSVSAYLDQLGTLDAERSAILNGLNSVQGVGLLNYVGHGAVKVLGKQTFFNTADVSGLYNGARLPVFTAFSCAVGNGSYPAVDSLAERLLWQPGGGTVATFASSSLSENGYAHQLNLNLVEALYGDSAQPTLGDAALAALAGFARQGGPRYMSETYSIVGDPALRYRR